MSRGKIFFIITIIFALDFLVWHKVLNQSLLGEGYYYFNQKQDFFSQLNNFKPLRQLDIFAKILFDVMPPIFSDNIRLYLLFLLLTMATLHTTLFLVITKITKSMLLGFTTSVFFLANYMGSFGMTASGQYQWFVQRVPNLIPTLIAFYYLEKFFHQKKFKFYLISIALFFVAVLLAHFSTFLLPVFILLPLVQSIGSKTKIKSLLLGITLTLPFVVISLIFNSQDGQSPKVNPVNYVLTQDKVIQKTIYQVAVISLPPNLIKFTGDNWPGERLAHPYTKVVAIYTYISLSIYFLAFFLVRKKNDRLAKLYITSLLGMLSIMFLYVYVDIKLDVLKGIGQSRQFFPSTIFLSIIWAIILHSIFYKKQKLYLGISITILVAYTVYNSTIINKHIDSIQYSSEMMKRFMAYTKSISGEFTSESIIITPSFLGRPSYLIKLFYAPQGFRFVLPSVGWEEEYRNESTNVFVFDYNYEKVGSKFYPEKGKVVDFTAKYRAGEKIEFLQQ